MRIQGFVIFIILLPSCHAFRNRTRFPRRQTFQHPAFSMFSMYPGLGMGSSRSYGQTECIREDIVCPAYCIMEDEWGCKSCPCGPANGMAPAIKEDHRSQTKDDHECLGTILCMLTCKDGYKLGPRGNNGCQSCECNKKNGTNSDQQSQQNQKDCTGPACSAKNGLHKASLSKGDSKEQKECEWPLCMNGQSTNAGPEPHNGLSPLPKGGNFPGNGVGGAVGGGSGITNLDCVGPECSAKNGGRITNLDCSGPECSAKNGGHIKNLECSGTECLTEKGGGITNHDCFGPECSAKNGMRLMDGVKPPIPTPSPKPHSCPSKKECADNCKGDSKLGPVGRNGCPVCECIIVKVPTTPSTRSFIYPEPTEKPCPQVDRCMQSCKYGFRLDQPRDNTKCPLCQCLIPLTPPPPTTTARPNVVGLLRVCPDAVHCMKTCTTGYTLTSSPDDECPVCICGKEPAVILLCEQPLACPNGCTVGYKCDTAGCPTCNCVAPKETMLRVEVHTTVMESALQCRPRFSCVDRCSFGYKTGDNGCPTCVCLQPVTVHTETLQLIPTPAQEHHNMLVMPQTAAPPSIPKPSGIGCLGPQCSAIHTLTGPGNVFMSAVNNFLPKLNGEKGLGEMTGQQQVPGNNPKPHPQKAHVVLQVGENGQPTDNIGVGEPQTPLETVITKTETVDKPLVGQIDQENLVESGPQSAMEACPETVQCISQCDGNFDLIPVDGTSCPACSCKVVEPPCDTCQQIVKEEVVSTPSPGQCVAILHCVMTCTEGYDIGEINQSDGCPTCTCLED